MAQCVVTCAKEVGCTEILDVGSGKGYLPTLVAWRGGFEVVAVDGQEANTSAAAQRSEKIRNLERKEGRKEEKAGPPPERFVTAMIGQNNEGPGVTGGTAAPDLEMVPLDKLVPDLGLENALLSGLHCCGDLTGEMIRGFHASGGLRAMAVAGCCYHRITEPGGFPMSSAAATAAKNCIRWPSEKTPPHWNPEGPGVALGFILRDQACHSVHAAAVDHSKWAHRISVTNAYVAVLVHLVQDFAERCEVSVPTEFISNRATTKGHTKVSCPFGTWASKMLAKSSEEFEKMGCDGLGQLSVSACEAFYDEHGAVITQQILAMDAVSACLRPVGEAVIVADRVAFLLEKGHVAHVEAMFDPVISARNWVIIARKA